MKSDDLTTHTLTYKLHIQNLHNLMIFAQLCLIFIVNDFVTAKREKQNYCNQRIFSKLNYFTRTM